MDAKRRLESEQGAILVFVAIAIIVLIGFLTFVFDYGILWVSRSEAQNSADSGALAGAIARAYDQPDETDPDVLDAGVTGDSARKTALDNEVWYATGGQQQVQVSYNCPTGVTGNCVRVDVYRNGEFGSSILPIVFGRVLGITTHGVRATATARVAFGNTTNCMRPFSVIDRWHEFLGAAEDFDGWDDGERPDPPPFDWYEPPTKTSLGSGYSVEDHFGVQVTLKTGSPAAQEAWSLPIRLPDGAGGYTNGADDFRDSIANCIGAPVSIGQYLPLENGEMTGPTRQGLEGGGGMQDPGLFEQDPDAMWDEDTNSLVGSCAPECAPFSPRIVPIAVVDVDEFIWRSDNNNWSETWVPGSTGTPGHGGGEAFDCPISGGGNKCVRVSNIIGFFVESVDGNGVNQTVTGRVVMYPGEFVTGTEVGEGSSFLRVIQLVR